MTRRPVHVDAAVRSAAACAFALIAHQVAGKAVRDALFLSSFPVTALPRVVVGAALVTIGAVLLASRALAVFGPARLLPWAFAGSAAIQVAIWPLVQAEPRVAAVVFYLHVSVGGAVLISWYWSMLNECLDPNTARRRIGRIAGAGTVGGLVGGLVAERVGAMLSTGAMMPVLAALHACSALLAFGAARELQPEPHAAPMPESPRSGIEVLRNAPYLRNLAFLVMIGTVSAALLDYVFKERAVQAFNGNDLLRFFGLFYTAVGLGTFLLQSTLTRQLLARGLARTASTLPAFVVAGGATALALPGLASAGLVRGLEAAVRSSLFRSSYELFYNPIRRADKRAAKTIVDVGFDRLGDAVGGGLVQLVLMGGIAVAPTLLALAIALGFLGLLMSRRLHRGYVAALEASLLDQGSRGAAPPVDDPASRSAFLQTVAQLDLSGPLPDLAESATTSLATAEMSRTAILPVIADPTPSPSPAPSAAPSAALPTNDAVLRVAAELRSGDASRVRRALAALDAPMPELVPMIIQLLAWDPVAPDAMRVLRAGSERHAGALVDALVSPSEEFSIRRRVARVLGSGSSERAVRGLLAALHDPRFEVRFQAGAALARLHEREPSLSIDRETVLARVEREASVNRQVWESNRLLDELGSDESPFYDEVLRTRSSRSLEHVFNMLSLVHPKQPLRIAYRGLHATDQTLRGTALEYLEQILPPRIREALWTFLDDDRRSAPGAKSLEDVVDSLMRSHESIQIDLEKLRRKES